MKVYSINNQNVFSIKTQNFMGQANIPLALPCPADKYEQCFDYIESSRTKAFEELAEVKFKRAISPYRAILALLNSEDTNITKALLYKMRTPDELEGMALDASASEFLRGLKVKKLIGLGASALAFETEDGKILKLTSRKHYPNRRKPDFFDVPIIKQGKSCRTYYYLEEKLSQDDLSQSELKKFVKEIEEKGYILRDIHHYTCELDGYMIKPEQFGRAKDGKIYLIDPECVLKPKKPLISFKNIINAIKHLLKIK